MTGPTRPSRPLSLNAILGIAALCATASVLVVPAASIDHAVPRLSEADTPSAASARAGARLPSGTVDERLVHRQLTSNVEALGVEAGKVLSVVGLAVDATTN